MDNLDGWIIALIIGGAIGLERTLNHIIKQIHDLKDEISEIKSFIKKGK